MTSVLPQRDDLDLIGPDRKRQSNMIISRKTLDGPRKWCCPGNNADGRIGFIFSGTATLHRMAGVV